MIDYLNSVSRHHGEYLPHLEVKCGTYFVTICLDGAIPSKLHQRLKLERSRQLFELERQKRLTPEGRDAIEWGHFLKVDALLDSPACQPVLGRDDIAQVVVDALEYFHGDRYVLDMWVIMGTHIHVIFQLCAENLLQMVLHSWKSFTANEINSLLGRAGRFWQRDYFDRSIRCDEQLAAIREYVWANPEAAGLRDWKWRRQY